MPLYEVDYQVAGETNRRPLADIEMGEEEARGFTEQSLEENLFPAGIKGVVTASVAEAFDQRNGSLKVTASVSLLVEAKDQETARAMPAPLQLLTKVIDGLLGEDAGRLTLDQNWNVSDVTEAEEFDCLAVH